MGLRGARKNRNFVQYKNEGYMERRKRHLVDEFAKACSDAGTSQATQLSLMMRQFIEEVKASE